jgi:4-amino-4-deoxy-L-arabinose transferase-like glycosyltransferase
MTNASPASVLRQRDWLRFALLALLVAAIWVYGLVQAPNYTDAYYHYNAAARLAAGQGLTDTYLWTYIGTPPADEAGVFPAFVYWMPLTAITAALSMTLTGSTAFWAAQLPNVGLVVVMALAAFWLGARLGGTRRHAWLAGLLALFSPFFVRYWGTTDTFALYGAVGAWALIALGLAWERWLAGQRAWPLWAAAGVLSGAGYLTRPDGLLLPAVAALLLLIGLWRMSRQGARLRSFAAASVVYAAAFAVVLAPWWLRNVNALGTPMPLGGTQSVWFTMYDDLFRYPPDASLSRFWEAGGLSLLLRTRWTAFAGESGLLSGNLGTFLAVEGMIVLVPFMLWGVWRLCRTPLLAPFLWFALGIHTAMTLVFPFPGYRGGLLHAVAALVPWWAALGVVGLDAVVAAIARRRRRWRAAQAQRVFGAALVGIAVVFSLVIGMRGRAVADTPALYTALHNTLPADARILLNDPAALYYHTGRSGFALPNNEATTLLALAERYDAAYVLLEAGGVPALLAPSLEPLPAFLRPLPFDVPGASLYAIDQNAAP